MPRHSTKPSGKRRSPPPAEARDTQPAAAKPPARKQRDDEPTDTFRPPGPGSTDVVKLGRYR